VDLLVLLRRNDGTKITLHKPHPSNVLKSYQIKNILKTLKEANII